MSDKDIILLDEDGDPFLRTGFDDLPQDFKTFYHGTNSEQASAKLPYGNETRTTKRESVHSSIIPLIETRSTVLLESGEVKQWRDGAYSITKAGRLSFGRVDGAEIGYKLVGSPEDKLVGESTKEYMEKYPGSGPKPEFEEFTVLQMKTHVSQEFYGLLYELHEV